EGLRLHVGEVGRCERGGRMAELPDVQMLRTAHAPEPVLGLRDVEGVVDATLEDVDRGSYRRQAPERGAFRRQRAQRRQGRRAGRRTAGGCVEGPASWARRGTSGERASPAPATPATIPDFATSCGQSAL